MVAKTKKVRTGAPKPKPEYSTPEYPKVCTRCGLLIRSEDQARFVQKGVYVHKGECP